MRAWLLGSLLMLPLPVAAQTRCTQGSVANLTFGSYAGASLTSTAPVSVTCPNGYAYQIGLGPGNNSTSTSTRKMANGANTLNYALFQNAARTINWGNVGGTDTVNARGTGTSQAYTLYGQVAAGQFVVPGTYTDTVATTPGPLTFTVTATVVAACRITATPLAFGTYTGVQLDAASTLSVTCTKTTPYYVNLGDGLHQDGVNYLPRMSGPGGQLLSYTMFRDAARSSRWGNTYNYDGVSGTGTGSSQSLTVYGRVVAAQFGTPGSYSDTIIATVTY
jgi:spore coat protein U-like protein